MTNEFCPSCGAKTENYGNGTFVLHEAGCPVPFAPPPPPPRELGIDSVSFLIGESTAGEPQQIVATMVDGSEVPVILPNAPPGWRVQHVGGQPIFRCPCGQLVFGAAIHVHEPPRAYSPGEEDFDVCGDNIDRDDGGVDACALPDGHDGLCKARRS